LPGAECGQCKHRPLADEVSYHNDKLGIIDEGKRIDSVPCSMYVDVDIRDNEHLAVTLERKRKTWRRLSW